MKKTSELKPWQDHAAKSLCRVGEDAGRAAVYVGTAYVCLRWLAPHLKTVIQQESQSDQQAVKEHNDVKNGNVVTTEKLSDVAGLEDVKTELQEKVIQPFVRPELFDRFKLKRGGAILLIGPPGCGKTHVARAIAGEVDAKFFPVNPAEIKSKWVGDTEKNWQRLFDEAKRHPRSVIFLDEVDALLSARGNRKIGSVTQFLQLSDGLIQTKNCLLLLAATNKPWMLDEAVTRHGRFGTHIYVGPPDTKAREAILALNLKGVPTAENVSLAEIADSMDGYTGADIAEMCDRAKRAAKNRQIGSGKDEVVTKGDFVEALGKIRPSVSPAQLKQFEDWCRNRQRLSEVDDDDD
jgi:SpoVK/Ycf46/Vps4 family AAA+-type ATPase